MAARRRWTNTGNSGVSVNTQELQQFIKDIKTVGARVHRVYLPEMLVAAAKPVETEAKLQAKAHSQSIPPTIKTRAYTSGMVVIKAGTKKVQLAALYEEGNVGGKPGRFKHPVFPKKGSDRNSWTWTSQTGYPFFKPAAIRALPEVDRAIAAIADQMVRLIARRSSL